MRKLAIIAVCVLLILSYTKQRQESKKAKALTIQIDSLAKRLDSIQSELYVREIEVGRYEYILDRAQTEITTDCVDQLNTIIGDTE